MSWTGLLAVGCVLAAALGLVILAGHVEHRRAHGHTPGRPRLPRDPRPVPMSRGDFDRRGEGGTGGIMGDLVIDPLTEAELARAGSDHGAESLALRPEMFRTTQSDVADEIWWTGFDWYLKKLDREADTLVASTDAIGATALDDFDAEMATYDEKIRQIIADFVHGEPEATLAMVSSAASAAGTVFTWSTGSYATVLSVPPAPVRELYAARIAQDPAPREAPAERFYATAGFAH